MHNTVTFSTRQKMALLDAKDACLRLLVAQRTKGCFELHLAVSVLVAIAMPIPIYTVRKALREATLAVGRKENR